jgi:hypothetical protein
MRPFTAFLLGASRTFRNTRPRMGTLYYGDNLDILRQYVGHATVDLAYLGPRGGGNGRALAKSTMAP